MVRGLLCQRTSRPSRMARGGVRRMETKLMRKATRTWSIFARRWTPGTGSLFGRAVLLGGAFLFGMFAA